MFKLTVIVVVALAVCAATNPIYQRPLGRRILARQQNQPTPAPTGYPPSDVTPKIPFELPTDTEKSAEVYGPQDVEAQQPAEVYGHPETDVQERDEVYRPGESEIQQPDEIYGPPKSETVQPEIKTVPEIIEETDDEAEEDENVEEGLDEELISDENDSVISVATTFEKPARLVYQRFPQRRQRATAIPERLVAVQAIKPANFLYTTRFQAFPQK